MTLVLQLDGSGEDMGDFVVGESSFHHGNLGFGGPNDSAALPGRLRKVDSDAPQSFPVGDSLALRRTVVVSRHSPVGWLYGAHFENFGNTEMAQIRSLHITEYVNPGQDREP